MSLKEQLADDTALFLNSDEMAETVTYDGSAILAVVDRGTLTRDGIEGNEIATTDGTSVRAEIFVAVEDVPSPQRGDRILDSSGTSWCVMYANESDAGLHALVCVADENPWG